MNAGFCVQMQSAQLTFRFYLVAILFIIFDLEAAFLFPWAVSLKHIGWAGWAAMMIFLAELVLGLVYAWKKRERSNGSRTRSTPPGTLPEASFNGLNDELSNKGFLVVGNRRSSFQWARTGSLWWMTFGLACCAVEMIREHAAL